MKNNIPDIYSIWASIDRPSTRENLSLLQYKNTNLWILKGYSNQFGFLLTDTMSKLSYDYKNIVHDWKNQMHDINSNKILKNCFIIQAKQNLDSKLFCSTISFLFDASSENTIFYLQDIEIALKKIESITLKENDEFNEVIGVWGELKLLHAIISVTKSMDDIHQVIHSWEGVDHRSTIDFNITSKKTKIEVKTTSLAFRIHEFNSIQQVEKPSDWNGYLASFCVCEEIEGLSCHNLVEAIRGCINVECNKLFEDKLTLRGQVCFNNKFKLVINAQKSMEFFDFDDVPRPIVNEGIGKVKWEAILENQNCLPHHRKNSLFELMNQLFIYRYCFFSSMCMRIFPINSNS